MIITCAFPHSTDMASTAFRSLARHVRVPPSRLKMKTVGKKVAGRAMMTELLRLRHSPQQKLRTFPQATAVDVGPHSTVWICPVLEVRRTGKGEGERGGKRGKRRGSI